LQWLYQPPAGGFDSKARSYRGYDHRRVRCLRPARPVRLALHEGDLVTLTNTDGATPVLLVALNEQGESDFESIGLGNNEAIAIVNQQQDLHAGSALSATADSAIAGLGKLLQWFDAQGGDRQALRAVQIFDLSAMNSRYLEAQPKLMR